MVIKARSPCEFHHRPTWSHGVPCETEAQLFHFGFALRKRSHDYSIGLSALAPGEKPQFHEVSEILANKLSLTHWVWIQFYVLHALPTIQGNEHIPQMDTNSTVSPGTKLTAQVQCFSDDSERAFRITGSEEVAVVIGFQPYRADGCRSPGDYLGQILYNRLSSPQYHAPTSPTVLLRTLPPSPVLLRIRLP
ncbi:hypothetical protein EDC04DRAFT_2602369 [Pisolithus marmoratus]|nr:hypothetical protein EDC04DRAFT_2602369 [Pisolithus marmoratus]